MARKTLRMTPAEAHEAVLDGRCPEGAEVDGDLHFLREPSLAELPKGLTVRGSLTVAQCHGLKRLPAGLDAKGIAVWKCARFEGFSDPSAALRVASDLDFRECPSLRAFPDRLEVGGDFSLERCARAWSRPEATPSSLRTGGRASIAECAGTACLPARMVVGSGLTVRGCGRLRSLPPGLAARSLFIKSCAALEGFDCDSANGFIVPGDLVLRDCPSLVRFPQTLLVSGWFRMEACPRAWADPHPPARVPTTFRAHMASIKHCAGLSRLPRDTVIDTLLHIERCDGLERLGPDGWLTVHGGCRIMDCDGLRAVDGICLTDGAELVVDGCAVLETVGTAPRIGSEEVALAAFECPLLSRVPEGLHESVGRQGCPSLPRAALAAVPKEAAAPAKAGGGSPPRRAGAPAP